MKKLLILLISILLFSCNNDKGKSKVNEPNLIDGYYKSEMLFKSDGYVEKGIWIFSKQEISMFEYVEKDYGDLMLRAIFKYYIKSNKLYECNCISSDCSDVNNLEEFYDIVSNKIENKQQIIILENSAIRITLIKTKQECLEVKEFKY